MDTGKPTIYDVRQVMFALLKECCSQLDYNIYEAFLGCTKQKHIAEKVSGLDPRKLIKL